MIEINKVKKKKEKEEKMNKTPYHIYDARYHAHPYILSTTVLSDSLVSLTCLWLVL